MKVVLFSSKRTGSSALSEVLRKKIQMFSEPFRPDRSFGANIRISDLCSKPYSKKSILIYNNRHKSPLEYINLLLNFKSSAGIKLHIENINKDPYWIEKNPPKEEEPVV